MRTFTYQHRHNCAYANQTVSIDVEDQGSYFIPPNAPRCIERPDEELVRTVSLVEEEDPSHEGVADEDTG
jgi:hypothetical protein